MSGGPFWLAGTLMPDYVRDNLAARGGGGFLSRLLKATGRCFLPPSELTGLMTIFFVVVGVVISLLHLRLWKRRGDGVFVSRYTRLAAAFAVAMAAAVMSGVSTRTSEGDRLLYFASCFLSMLAAALLLVLVEKKWIWWSLAVVYLTGSVFFIEENNGRWRTASRTAAVILDSLKASPARHTVLINAPDEWEGAYIFRNNLDRALSINGIPPASVFVNNNLMRLDYLPVRGRIDVSGKGDSLWIYPDTKIFRKDGVVEIGNTRTGVVKVLPLEGTRLYYWDKIQLKRVVLP